MLDKKNGKKLVTVLLVLSCIVSGIILAASPDYKNYQIENAHELDSLLNVHIQDAQIKAEQIRVTSIRIDTIFTRKEYRIEVPSRFSKTLFHVDLHKDLFKYDMQAPAKVHFPSHDMDIYIYDQGTVLRSIRLTTNPELDSLATPKE
ncbi:MAG: hypothetical protein JJ953_14335 [Gracilimonas sp.]|uniref:hypothetical protein n=1 Tax=Gracilimonas TaxID=649462 RepID=UPI001AFEDBD4|nr:hypothetical protein [Gracilimonas sp.]MBO6587285.1 hypothetical protein [Gracilimonas sp.]MBO6614227.1 hypothetical protein [Gracilimonas sp.]